jgi:sugar O-acyltransferase (sialic acid O-acetyltransferase NeuD family)
MNKKQIILIGGGGHCKSCIDVIESGNEYEIVGIIDTKDKIGDFILGYKIIGCDDDLPQIRKQYKYAIITVGQIKLARTRNKIFKILKENDFLLPIIIAPTAYVSKYAKLSEGTIVMHQAFVNANARIGKNCIINSKSLIEHDTTIGNQCHVSTNCVLNGNVTVGSECFIGSGTVLTNGISVVSNVTIGMGSVIVKNISESGLYFGSPVKKIR